MAITSDGKPSTPDLVIKSGDAELTNWIDMEVENHLHLPDTFTVRLLLEDSRERPFATMDEVVKDFLEEGRQVEISRREDSRDRVLICGEVTSVSLDLDSPGPGACDSVVLHGFDRSHRMHRTRKTRVFNQWSFKEVVKTIAEEAKLKAVFDQEDRLLASGGDYLLIQENQTNWEFLWQLADQVGYEVFVEEGILFFQRPDNERRDTVELTWGEDLSQFRARASTASQFSAVTVQGWDQKNNEVIRGTADQGEGSPRLGDARPGTDQAKNAFGESPVVVNRPVHSGADADKMAQSLANDIAGEFVIAEGATTRGMADIKPGVTLRIGDIGHRMSGDYYVTSTTHRYTDEEGYTTSFVVSGRRHYTLTDLLQPGSHQGRGTGLGGVVVGVVTHNRDEEDLGRVRVQFPWLDDAAVSDWAPIVALGAGRDRGMYWLPEVGDQVLVAFEHGDIHHPYILGGLWSMDAKPPRTADEAVEKYDGKVKVRELVSTDGLKLVLSDDPNNMHVGIYSPPDQSGQRSKVAIQYDKKGDIVIKSLDGNICVEADTQLEIKCGGSSIKIEKSGDINIQASGNLTIKGAQVHIN